MGALSPGGALLFGTDNKTTTENHHYNNRKGTYKWFIFQFSMFVLPKGFPKNSFAVLLLLFALLLYDMDTSPADCPVDKKCRSADCCHGAASRPSHTDCKMLMQVLDGKICGKQPYLMVKSMVSCKFSYWPTQWLTYFFMYNYIGNGICSFSYFYDWIKCLSLTGCSFLSSPCNRKRTAWGHVTTFVTWELKN